MDTIALEGVTEKLMAGGDEQTEPKDTIATPQTTQQEPEKPKQEEQEQTQEPTQRQGTCYLKLTATNEQAKGAQVYIDGEYTAGLDANFVSEDGKYRRPQTEEEKLSINEKREKALLKEFEELLLEARGSKKKIKEVRKQAVLFGFEYCYKRERFKDILTLANKLNRTILENDSELNEFVEVAQIKVEGM